MPIEPRDLCRTVLQFVVFGGMFLTSGDWVIISSLYIGGQAVIDAVVKLKGA